MQQGKLESVYFYTDNLLCPVYSVFYLE
jgi:hypothetical protein